MKSLEKYDRMSPAILALADGSTFSGISIGAPGHTVGEVVFNTSITGYQEILTDPSYAQQIITLTYPHIGNVGLNPEDLESNQVLAAGLVIRDLSRVISNWRSTEFLHTYLREADVVAIANIDTRRLTRILRDKGAQSGCIMVGEQCEAQALALARSFPTLSGKDLAKEVSTPSRYEWFEASDNLISPELPPEKTRHIVVYDFGVKRNILRLLIDKGCRVTVVSAQTPLNDVLTLKPDGILFSNGPGDPAACDYAIAAARQCLEKNIPLLGICLGFQILALACGAKTFKMKFGHHGANHPVKDLRTHRVYITSQNHGFAVQEEKLPSDLEVTHRSLFDNTLQGLKHRTRRMMAFQGHPEASPGPHDINYLFNEFLEMI